MKQTGRRFDAAAFYGGTNSEAYRYLGAHRTRRAGKDGYVFRVWAPHAVSVSVIGDFNRVGISDVEKLMAGDGTGRVQR